MEMEMASLSPSDFFQFTSPKYKINEKEIHTRSTQHSLKGNKMLNRIYIEHKI